MASSCSIALYLQWLPGLEQGEFHCKKRSRFTRSNISLATLPVFTENSLHFLGLRLHHIETRVFVRSPKLCNVVRGHYQDQCPFENNRCCKFKCAVGVMDEGSELEIRESGSNFSSLYSLTPHANAMNAPFLTTSMCYLISATIINIAKNFP